MDASTRIKDKLASAGFGEIIEYIEDLEGSNRSARREIARLQTVIEDHTRPLSVSLAGAVSAECAVAPNDDGISREAVIEFRPLRARHHVPFEFKTWSKDHQQVFARQMAELTGAMAADALVKELWLPEVANAKPQDKET